MLWFWPALLLWRPKTLVSHFSKQLCSGCLSFTFLHVISLFFTSEDLGIYSFIFIKFFYAVSRLKLRLSRRLYIARIQTWQVKKMLGDFPLFISSIYRLKSISFSNSQTWLPEGHLRRSPFKVKVLLLLLLLLPISAKLASNLGNLKSLTRLLSYSFERGVFKYHNYKAVNNPEEKINIYCYISCIQLFIALLTVFCIWCFSSHCAKNVSVF